MAVNESWLKRLQSYEGCAIGELGPHHDSAFLPWSRYDSECSEIQLALARLWHNSRAPFCAFHSAFSCQRPSLAVKSGTLFLRGAQNNPALLPCFLLQASSQHGLLWTICLFLNLPCPNHLLRAHSFQDSATERAKLRLSVSEQLYLTGLPSASHFFCVLIWFYIYSAQYTRMPCCMLSLSRHVVHYRNELWFIIMGHSNFSNAR